MMKRINGSTYESIDGRWRIQNQGKRCWSVIDWRMHNSDLGDWFQADAEKQYFQSYAQAAAEVAHRMRVGS